VEIGLCAETDKRVLTTSIEGADVFLGLSAAGVLKPEMLKDHGEKPLIMALANPSPEIMPDEAREGPPRRDDLHRAFGFPQSGQQRPVFPLHLPRRARLRRAHHQREMKMAAVRAIAATGPRGTLRHRRPRLFRRNPGVRAGVPHPLALRPAADPRIAPAVAKAAADSPASPRRPIEDMDAYVDQLNRFVFRSGLIMKPLFTAAKAATKKRVVLPKARTSACCAQPRCCLRKSIAEPILIGRPGIIESRLQRFGLRIKPGVDFESSIPRTIRASAIMSTNISRMVGRRA
jgi:malate dehydrogenase (oxaloacetate-decarboxylating)(NADP+)